MPEILKLPVPKGLRPVEDLIYDLQYLEQCQNLYLNRSGVFEAEKFTRTTFTGVDISDDSIQVFPSLGVTGIGNRGANLATLRLDDTESICSADDTSLVEYESGIARYDRTLRWSSANFGNFAIIANPYQIHVRGLGDGWSTNNALFPLSKAICAHRGRLVLAFPETSGTPYGSFAGHSQVVAWSKVNELKFQETGTPDISNQAGWIPLEQYNYHYPSIGVARIEPLKQHVIVYGDLGISALTLAGAHGYAMTKIHPYGIKNAGAVCLNGFADGTTVHYFLDYSWDLFMVDANLKVTKIGYKEIFAAEIAANPGMIMMNYNSRRDELLINFFDSNKTYIYGANGLTYITGDIETMWEGFDIATGDGSTDNRLIHSPSAISQTDIVYQTNTIDMGVECQKYLWGFSARITCPEKVSVVIDYRTERTGSWISSCPMTFDKARGYLNVGRLAGVEFKIKITVASYTTFQMSDITVKYSKINGGEF